ncbi:hypothetical protein T09_14454 [Trichinella sp. T9]|nr:hypothetical protein T09_14454 [Trichinella sp. T9]
MELQGHLPSRRADLAILSPFRHLCLLQQYCWMLWSDENHLELYFFALIIHETKHHALQSLLDYLSVFLSVIFCPTRVSSFLKNYNDEK